MPSGELSVLNCSAGDIRVSFDKDNVAEVERAKRMICDMLKRGYIIAVERKGKTSIVKDFDPKTNEYIIVEGALYAGDPPSDPAKRGRPSKVRVPMASTKATAIPPTGGG